ncbi:MAG: glycerophosphodiester phosphodiesterase family protein [Amaricoccus sp.]
MPAPTSVTRNGHRTFLKWHRARRRAADPVFTGRRIVEGMRAGASVEVDLVVHADAGFAVLHEPALGIETTGSGLVRHTPAAVLRTLRLRDNAGTPTGEPVMLLEDLAALIAREGAHPDALLQLDYKEDADALPPAALATFARALGPVARHFILSSGDAAAVRLLSADVPGLRIGHDPCHEGAIARVTATRAWPAFVAGAVAASPAAELVYVDHALVLAAAADGFDLVAAFHRAGRRVDAYTIRRADPDGLAAACRLLDLRVDQITTDDPEGLAAALR